MEKIGEHLLPNFGERFAIECRYGSLALVVLIWATEGPTMLTLNNDHTTSGAILVVGGRRPLP